MHVPLSPIETINFTQVSALRVCWNNCVFHSVFCVDYKCWKKNTYTFPFLFFFPLSWLSKSVSEHMQQYKEQIIAHCGNSKTNISPQI